MFKKAMQVPDALVYRYLELGTSLPLDEAKALTEHDIKEAHRVLARELVRTYHGDAPIEDAEARFDYVAKGGIPDDVPEVRIDPAELSDGAIWICKLATLAGLTASNGEARRLIQNRGLKLGGEAVTDVNAQVTLPVVLQKGKDSVCQSGLATCNCYLKLGHPDNVRRRFSKRFTLGLIQARYPRRQIRVELIVKLTETGLF